MEVDPNNPVVRLCAEGMSAEMAGKTDQATRLYQEAWEARKDDYEACIASHYLARVQKTPSDVLNWNRESLRHADAVNDERVAAFYPSLYLSTGKAYEDLGKKEKARKFYDLAESKAAILPEGEYGSVVRRGIGEVLKRVADGSGEGACDAFGNALRRAGRA